MKRYYKGFEIVITEDSETNSMWKAEITRDGAVVSLLSERSKAGAVREAEQQINMMQKPR